MARNIKRVYAHHSVSSRSTKAKTIKRWHLAKKPVAYIDIGYHYVIEEFGLLRYGRQITAVGAHVKGDNKGSVGVCIPGNNVLDARAKDGSLIPHSPWDPQQVRRLELLFGQLDVVLCAPKFGGHRDYPKANTECPGFDVTFLGGMLSLDGLCWREYAERFRAEYPNWRPNPGGPPL